MEMVTVKVLEAFRDGRAAAVRPAGSTAVLPRPRAQRLARLGLVELRPRAVARQEAPPGATAPEGGAAPSRRRRRA